MSNHVTCKLSTSCQVSVMSNKSTRFPACRDGLVNDQSFVQGRLMTNLYVDLAKRSKHILGLQRRNRADKRLQYWMHYFSDCSFLNMTHGSFWQILGCGLSDNTR